jgi:DNA invertase Pin-like site-specific DNA recombinase
VAISRTTPKNGRPVRAITYERISLDKTGEEAGVGRQTKDNKGYCARQGWTIVADLHDDDISASRYSKKKRPAYLEAIRMLTEGEADALVAYHLDRLWRQPKELEHLIDLVEQRGILVATLNGEIDLMTGDGRLMARMLVAVAAAESDNASRRISRHWAAWRENGRPVSRLRTFGWSDPLTPNPAEAALIVDAIDAVLAGESVGGVARHWQALGVGHVNGGVQPWSTGVVRRILTNPQHAGLVHYRGEIIGEGVWAPIVDRQRFERVCAVIEANASKFGKGKPRRRRFLTGLVVCGLCGTPMSRGGPAEGGKRNWKCHKSPRYPDACGGCSINADHLERFVTDVVFERVDEIDLSDLIAADVGDKHAAATIELADLERRDDELGVMFSRKKISARAFESASADLQSQMAGLRAQLARTTRGSVLARFAGQPGALEAEWDGLSVDQQRAIVAAAIGPVRIAGWRPDQPRRFDATRVILGDGSAVCQTTYTIAEAAERAGLTDVALYQRWRKGNGPPFRKVFSMLRVPVDDFEQWMRDAQLDPVSQAGLMTVPGVAAAAGVSDECIRWHVRKGIGPAFRTDSSGHWVVPVDEFERWMRDEFEPRRAHAGFLTVVEAAKRARLTPAALYNRRRKGKGPAFAEHWGQLMVSTDDLEQWMRDEGITPAEPRKAVRARKKRVS